MSGANRGSRGVAGLVRVFGGGAAMHTVLPLDRGAIDLGSGSQALAAAPDLCISKRHLRVEFDGERVWVTDEASRNGTFVDGVRVPARTPHAAERVIRAGESLFLVSTDVGPLLEHGVLVRDGFVRGPAMQRVLTEIARAAELGISLCLFGETGTGKEGVARAFHATGSRGQGPFIAVNCAAIPSGLAERLLFGVRRGAYSGADADAPGYAQAADGGTLFLDEVAELDLAVQAKLLRVLETREVLALGATQSRVVDFQLCSASNRDLRAEAANGRLREDLYFRIGRPQIMLPALRDRPEEIAFLIERELARVRADLRPRASLVEVCLRRPWPGNVRELLAEVRSAGQSALLRGEAVAGAHHLSASAGAVLRSEAAGAVLRSEAADASRVMDALPTPPPRDEPELRSRAWPLDGEERARIESALRNHGNVAAAARALGMHRTHLRRLIKRHGLAARVNTEPP